MKPVRFFNLILWNLFRFEIWTQRIIHYPFGKILNMKCVQNLYKKRGVSNPNELVLSVLSSPETSINSMYAEGHYIVLFFLLFFCLTNVFLGLLQNESHFSLVHFVLFSAMAFCVTYFISFRKDKYLRYYKEFNKLPKREKRRSAWMTFFITVLVWVSTIVSFPIRYQGIDWTKW